ncbi:hypothetical protein [Microbulbifer thermotolerans]|uniref:hypothetical protein n=1 Tax=Microbulbifer thermotolerans TaxID=252514 RepID=UPI002248C57F|nr:hypothetical protein [Microbulbifer thermotolerans]
MALLKERVLRVFSEGFGAFLWNNFIVIEAGEAKKAPTKVGSWLHAWNIGLFHG